jgi:chromosomal replication initiation ATPase DnaA
MDEEESRLRWLVEKDYSDAVEVEFEIQRSLKDKDPMDLAEIIECVSRYYDIQENDISQKRQQRAYVTARSAIVYIAAKQDGIKFKDIAIRLNMSQSNISTILSDLNKLDLMSDSLSEILNLRSLTR